MAKKRLTVAETEANATASYGPGGFWRYDQYSRSTLLRIRRDAVKWLAEERTGLEKARLRGMIAGLTACLEAGKDRAKFENRVKIRQVGGDDGYHWVVYLDNRLIMNGLTRTEAMYEKKRQVDYLMSL